MDFKKKKLYKCFYYRDDFTNTAADDLTIKALECALKTFGNIETSGVEVNSELLIKV